jgi:zinc transport system permease protein
VIARQFTHRLRNMMFIATFVSAIFTSAGLIISYYLSWSSGATIVLLLSAGFLFISQAKRLLGNRKKFQKNENSA